MELYILALAGVALHLLTKIFEARKNKLKLDFVLESLATLISLIIVSVLVYSKDDLEAFYPVNKITAIILGYIAQSLFRVLIKSFKPNEEGAIGSKKVLSTGGHPDPKKEEK